MANKKFNENPWGYDQTKVEKENKENDPVSIKSKKNKKE